MGKFGIVITKHVFTGGQYEAIDPVRILPETTEQFLKELDGMTQYMPGLDYSKQMSNYNPYTYWNISGWIKDHQFSQNIGSFEEYHIFMMGILLGFRLEALEVKSWL